MQRSLFSSSSVNVERGLCQCVWPATSIPARCICRISSQLIYNSRAKLSWSPICASNRFSTILSRTFASKLKLKRNLNVATS